MDIAQIATKLREVREGRGMSHRDLMEVSGVHYNTLSGIETGKHKPRPSTLRKLADALDVDIEDLTGAPAPKADALPSPERRRTNYLLSWVDFIEYREHRLREAIRADSVTVETVQEDQQLLRDIEQSAAPRIGLLRGAEAMPKEEAQTHYKLAAALDSLHAAIAEGYDVSIKKLTDQRATVEDFPTHRRRATETEEPEQVKRSAS